MATLEELVVRLEADNAQLVSALQESAKVTARSSKQMEDAIASFTQQSTKETKKFGDVMTVFAGTTLSNLAVKGAELAAQAFQSLLSNFTEGIGESAEFEQNMVRLSNSMAMSGNFTAEASKDLATWSDEMEALSGIDDAVIAGNLAMLSSMTRLDAEGLKRAQESAINLSAALGIDLNTATKMVGKAAEGNTDMFKKYGVVIEESADKNLTFANTLKAVEGRFAGAAGGAMKTFEGSLLGLKNAWGNIFQVLGDVVVKNPAVIATFNQLGKILGEVKTYFEANAGVIRKGFAEALTTVIQVVGVFATAVNVALMPLNVILKNIAFRVQTVIDTFQAAAAILSGKGLAGAAEAFKESKERAAELQVAVSNMINLKGPIDGLVVKIFEVANAAEDATKAMSDKMEPAKATIENIKKKVQELTWAQKEVQAASTEMAMGLAQDALNIQTQYQMTSDAQKMSYDTGITNFEQYKAQMIGSQADLFAKEQEQLITALETGKITKEQFALAEIQQKLKQDAAKAKMEQDFNKQRIDNVKGSLGVIATLTSSSNKQLAEMGKAAAIAQATIDGYLAIQKAWAQGGIFGAVLSVGVAAATAANIAKISGVGLASGIDSVPGVGTKDNFPAVLAPGERVVPSETNKDLTEFLEKQQENQAAPTFNLNFYGPVWGDKASAGAEIVEAINEALARGMSLRILST